MKRPITFNLKVNREYIMDDTYLCFFLNVICSSRCAFNEDGDVCEGDLTDRPRWCPLTEIKNKEV